MKLMPMYDIAIIGGGINGVGIALDAAGRGLSVLLCEQHDLASATSSASSKLIHGGLRYLEHGKFRLVREALTEREILLHKAPHLIHPLQFIMPHQPHMRSHWLIRLGLLIYDHLGHRRLLKPSTFLKRKNDSPFFSPLQTDLTQAFSYWDCWVDDARLVIANAIAAKNHGATILSYTRCERAERKKDHWQLTLQSPGEQTAKTIHARCLINATGPWVSDVLNNIIQKNNHLPIRLVKGSHIVVPRLYKGNHAYLLQNDDKRIVFITPFFNDYHLIGTTDIAYEGDPANVTIDEYEIHYLCKITQRYLQKPVTPSQIIHHYSGIRALLDEEKNDPSTLSRDYIIQLHHASNEAPLIIIIGGKLTTYRKLAETVLKKINYLFPHMKPAWTAYTPLPGGEFNNEDFDHFLKTIQQRYSWLPEDLCKRYVACYGTRIKNLLANKSSIDELGKHFGHGLYQAEVEYLIKEEWANTAEDILWRRTKLGLKFSDKEHTALIDWLDN